MLFPNAAAIAQNLQVASRFAFTRFLLLTTTAFALTSSFAFAQIPTSFNVFDVDTSQFPIMKARFFAFDANGSPWQNALDTKDIILLENGARRTITSVTCPPQGELQALSAVLTLDISVSMIEGRGKFTNLQLAQRAATAFVQALGLPPSEAAVSSFNHESYINQDFTASQSTILSAISAFQPTGGTEYMNGLLAELTGSIPIALNGRNKRVVVFLTDGLSDGDEEAVVKAAKDNSVEIYTVAVGLPAPPFIRNIARRTGGVCFENVNDFARITQVYQAIVQLAQGRTPCEFTWRGEAVCDTRTGSINARLRGALDSLAVTLDYDIPQQAVARLLVSPFSVRFYNVPPGTSRDTTITIRAENAPFTVTNFLNTSTNAAFTVTPTNFTLAAGESRQVTLRFTPRDSSLTFARFEVKTNSCTALLYASGGFPPVPVVQPTLRLTAPNGGEIFLAGADTVITWEGVLPTDTVRLQYSIDSGKTWRTITDTATGLRYAWKNIPNTPSEKCLMRVMSNGFEEKTITLRGHTKNVVSCSFNNDGSRLLTTGNFEAIIKIWDVISGKEIQSISPPSNFINTAVFSPTGNQIAISGDGYGVEIIDGLTLKRIAHKVLYSTKALFSPNGQYLLVVNDYIGVMLFNPNTLQEIRRIPAALPLNDAVFSHNGDLIVTAHNDGLVKIWDTKTGQEIRSLKSASQKTIFCAVMSSDGSRIIAAGDNSEIIDTQTGALICKIEANARSNVGNQACFSNDGTQVLIATNSGAYIVNAFTGKTIKHYQLANDMSVNPTLSVAYSPDMSKIAFSGAPIAKIITNNFAQTSTSANVWSIISPQLSTSTARTIDMGAALVSTSKDSVIQTFLTNASPYPVRVDSLRFGGAQAQEFSMVSGQPPFVIAAGASAAVEFRFRPSAVSLRTASLLVFTQSDTVRLSIQGTGVQQSLTQRTRVIDFGRVLLGTNKDTMLTGILRNTGGVPITLSAPRLGLPDTTQFSVRGFGAVGASAVAPTYTLQAGDSVAIALRFAPSRLGRTSGQVQFRYAVPGVSSAFAPLSVGLFGEGILQALTAQTLVDMGTVVVGSLRDSTVQAFITNPNARAISLDAVRFENTQNAAQALDFTCLAILPQTIPANAMIALSFRFRPSAAGLRTAQIVMGAETQTLRASIQGNGTELRSGSLQLPSIQARVGGLVQMPIFLRNRIGDIPVGTTVSANLMYFYGLLRPQPPTPLGTVSGTMRTIPLQLTVPSLDENIPLSTVTFRAAFAFPQATTLSLSNMTATPSMALTAQQGSFTLLDAPLPTFSLQPSNDAAFGNGGEQNTAVRILSISPNPAQTGFSVRFAAPEGESVSLSVHNALATPVLARNLAFGANEATISTNSWTPGVYTLRVQTASGLAVGRVVVVP